MANKQCKVCGMPLQKADDYPNGNESLGWCKHCGTETSLYPYDALVKGMSKFMQESQGMEEEQADLAAAEFIANSEAVKTGMLKKQ